MPSEVDPLLQLMQASPSIGASPAVPSDPSVPLDPMMSDPLAASSLGQGLGAVGAFPSTDPSALAQVVQEALAGMASQDHQLLEMQQQQAAMAAQPIIDQMMLQAAAPQPAPMPMGDPMQAFGEAPGTPPLPPTELVA